jgi:anti-sigma factor RsiW
MGGIDMTCEHWQERLPDHLASELADEEAIRLEQHLAECSACAQEEERLRKTIQAALPSVKDDVDPLLEARLLQELREASQPRDRHRARDHRIKGSFGEMVRLIFTRRVPAFATVALVLIGIAGGFLLGQTGAENLQGQGGELLRPVRDGTAPQPADGPDGFAGAVTSGTDTMDSTSPVLPLMDRGWVRFATAPTDAISLSYMQAPDTL